jgi:phage/plasmid-like protein (TIGR03299 family)
MDNIATINGQKAMAYQGETPWHKLGSILGKDPSVEEAQVKSALKWKVKLEPMFIKDDQGRLIKVAGRRAVVRDVDSTVLATVGKQYHPLQNDDAFSVLEPARKKFGIQIETAGALGRGDRVWMLAKMPESVEPVPGDEIRGYILIVTGHNGWTPYTGRFTSIRVVCHNTLQMATRQSEAFVKLHHSRDNKDQLEQVGMMITTFTAALKESNESFTRLAKKKMNRAQLFEYVNSVLGIHDDEDSEVRPVLERRREKIIELAATGKGVEFAPGTAWSALNAVTEYIDHVRPAEVKAPRMLKQANESALFGANARIKMKAFVLAQQFAKR